MNIHAITSVTELLRFGPESPTKRMTEKTRLDRVKEGIPRATIFGKKFLAGSGGGGCQWQSLLLGCLEMPISADPYL